MVSHMYFKKNVLKPIFFLNVPWVCVKICQISFAQGPLCPVANADFTCVAVHLWK